MELPAVPGSRSAIMQKRTNVSATQTETARTWWLTGLSGAGKSTLANALRHALLPLGETACVIDGDELRTLLSHDLGFSTQDREENMRRAAAIARLLNEQGIHAIVAMVSPTRAGRERARNIIGAERFLEVHVSTPLDICATRDPKGLYARARQDASLELTGMTAPYQSPANPAMRLDTSRLPIEEGVRQLLELRETPTESPDSLPPASDTCHG